MQKKSNYNTLFFAAFSANPVTPHFHYIKMQNQTNGVIKNKACGTNLYRRLLKMHVSIIPAFTGFSYMCTAPLEQPKNASIKASDKVGCA